MLWRSHLSHWGWCNQDRGQVRGSRPCPRSSQESLHSSYIEYMSYTSKGNKTSIHDISLNFYDLSALWGIWRSYPGHFGVHWLRVGWSQAGGMVTCLTYLALQDRLNKNTVPIYIPLLWLCLVKFIKIQELISSSCQSDVVYLWLLASTAAHVTEFAAPAAPVLLRLLLRALIRCEAEIVERLTADLAKYHLEDERHLG